MIKPLRLLAMHAKQKNVTRKHLAYMYFTIPIILAIVTMLIASCKEKSNITNTGIIEIPVNVSDETEFNKFYSSFVEDIDFLPLETTPSNSIKQVADFLSYKNNLYIQQGHEDPIMVFNENGKFKSLIGKFGKGPGEVDDIRSMALNNDSLIILDYIAIHAYDVNGNYLKYYTTGNRYNTPLSFYPDNFYFHNNYTYFFSCGRSEEFALYVFNSEGKMINKYFPMDYLITGFDSRFVNCGDKVLLIPPTGIDTIYALDNGNLLPVFHFNFGSAGINENDNLPTDKKDIWAVAKYFAENKKVSQIANVVDLDNFILFRFLYMNRAFMGVYDKYTNETKVLKSNSFSNVFNLLTSSLCIKKYDNNIIGFVNAWQIVDALEKKDYMCTFLPEKRRLELLEKLKNVKETDNPVLMIIKTKK
jgi:hypothetical protein